MVTMDLFGTMLEAASDNLDKHIKEFSEIDSKFGDGDHGVTMQRISKEIRNIGQEFIQKAPTTTAESFTADTVALLMDLSKRVMNVNGGSAGPLYGTIFEGFAEGIEQAGVEEGLTTAAIQSMLAGAVENFSYVSNAKVGDKTMVDTLIPVAEAIQAYTGDLTACMNVIATTAQTGAESSKNHVAKFGRARFHKEATIGTMDAGAYSLACFFIGFSNGFSAVAK